jgi:hypothetical protein
VHGERGTSSWQLLKVHASQPEKEKKKLCHFCLEAGHTYQQCPVAEGCHYTLLFEKNQLHYESMQTREVVAASATPTAQAKSAEKAALITLDARLQHLHGGSGEYDGNQDPERKEAASDGYGKPGLGS